MARSKRTWWILVLPRGFTGTSLLSGTFITNRLIPAETIEDDKKPIFQEFQIPGLDYSPVQHVRNENTVITFSVPIVNKKSTVGNLVELNAIEQVRMVQRDLSITSEAQWNSNPLVVYSGWGTHRPPLPAVVVSAPFSHETYHTLDGGYSSFTRVTFTLRYVENHPMYLAWKKLMQIGGPSAIAQAVGSRGYPF